MAWQDGGACVELEPARGAQLFYPGGYGPTFFADIAVSKAICAACPVQAECLTHGLDREDWGTWGGYTEWERLQFRGRWRRGEITVAEISKHGSAEVAKTCTLGKSGRRCIACATWWREHNKTLYAKRCTFCGGTFNTSRSDGRFCKPEHASRYRKGYRRRQEKTAS